MKEQYKFTRILLFLGNIFSVRTYQSIIWLVWLYLLIDNSLIHGSIYKLGFTAGEAFLFFNTTLLIVASFLPLIKSSRRIRTYNLMKKVKVGKQNYYLFIDDYGHIDIFLDCFFFRVFVGGRFFDGGDDELKEYLKKLELERLEEIKKHNNKQTKPKINFDKVYLSKEDERLDKLNKI